MVPTSTKTTVYGDIKESTIVFTSSQQSTVQVTTITNTKTNKTSTLDSKVLPTATLRPLEVVLQLPVRVIPRSAILVAIKQFPEL